MLRILTRVSHRPVVLAPSLQRTANGGQPNLHWRRASTSHQPLLRKERTVFRAVALLGCLIGMVSCHTIFADASNSTNSETDNKSARSGPVQRPNLTLPQEVLSPKRTQPLDLIDALELELDILQKLALDPSSESRESTYQSALHSSIIPIPESGILRFDTVLLLSEPSQHTFLSAIFCNLPTQTWSFFGVFPTADPSKPSTPLGSSDTPHRLASNTTAAFLSRNLLLALVGSLGDLFSKHAPIHSQHTEVGFEEPGDSFEEWFYHHVEPPHQEIVNTIATTFARVDDQICQESAEDVVTEKPWTLPPDGAEKRENAEEKLERVGKILAPALTASGALVAFYESDKRMLWVATTGSQVKAVLGTRRKPVMQPKTIPQETSTSSDYSAYVASFLNSSVFGGAYDTHKWPQRLRGQLQEYLGETPTPPPYSSVTPGSAIPEIATATIEAGDFLLITTGLSDVLKDDDLVRLVGDWIVHSKSPPPGTINVATPNQSAGEVTFPSETSQSMGLPHDDANVSAFLLRNIPEPWGPQPEGNGIDSMGAREDVSIVVVFFE